MGKVDRRVRRFFRKQKAKMSAPKLPKEVMDEMARRGIEIHPTDTINSLYEKVGLSVNPNSIDEIGYKDSLKQARDALRAANAASDEEEQPKEKSHLFEEVMNQIPDKKGYEKHLSEYEIRCVAQLQKRYGDDYEMMAMDHRFNPMQWTIAQLQEKFRIYELQTEKLRTYTKIQEEQAQQQAEVTTQE